MTVNCETEKRSAVRCRAKHAVFRTGFFLLFKRNRGIRVPFNYAYAHSCLYNFFSKTSFEPIPMMFTRSSVDHSASLMCTCQTVQELASTYLRKIEVSFHVLNNKSKKKKKSITVCYLYITRRTIFVRIADD